MVSVVQARDLKSVCGGSYDPESTVTAAIALAALEGQNTDFSLNTLLRLVIKSSDSKCLHESCSQIKRIFDSGDSTIDYYTFLTSLTESLEKNKNLSDQAKIAGTLSSVLKHILIKYHSQQGEMRQIGKLDEKAKLALIEKPVK